MDAEVIVAGLGSMGSSAARHLAARGVSVIGLDRFRPPHHLGAHSGGTRIIRMAYAEGSDYVPLLRSAYRAWTLLEQQSGQVLKVSTGGLLIGPPESAQVSGALRSARTHGLAHEVLDPAAVAERYPQFRLAAGEMAVYEPTAGVLRAEATIGAQLALAAAGGAQLRYDTPVTGWTAEERGVTVRTGDGDLRASRLVLAPGAWAASALGGLPVPFELHRRVQHYWSPAGDPADYAAGRMPVWIWEDDAGMPGYGLPWQDDVGGVKAAFHYAHYPLDPDQPNPEPTPDEVELVRDWLTDRLPQVAAGRHVGAVTCRYTMTPDEHFVVGAHPESARVTIAAGFSGHGFKFAPLMGEILADLALDGGTAHPIGLFNPLRFATVT
jgi:sarcosine oxidase